MISDMKTKNQIRSEVLKRVGKPSGKEVLATIPWEGMSSRIGEAIKDLLAGQKQLRDAYRAHLDVSRKRQSAPKMTFAFDGRLVGDIGELIAAEIFDIVLLGTKSRNVDGFTSNNGKRKVQIKATFQTHTLSIKHGADYFLGLQLEERGRFRVVYNGRAKSVMTYLKAPKAARHSGRKHAGTRLEPISLEAWSVLNLAVPDAERIPRRKPRRKPRRGGV